MPGVDIMEIAQKMMAGEDVSPTDIAGAAQALRAFGVEIPSQIMETLQQGGGVPQALHGQMLNGQKPQPQLQPQAQPQPQPQVQFQPSQRSQVVRPRRKTQQQAQQQEQGPDIQTMLNEMGPHLSAAVGDMMPGIDLSMAITPEGIRLAAIIPPDEENPEPEWLAHIEVLPSQLGDGIADVIQAAVEEVNAGG